MKTNIIKLVSSIIGCQLAGIIGSFFTSSSIPTWYAGLKKPSFNPPNWLFGPVWVTLYLMMGISLYLIWNKGLEAKGVKTAMIVFGIQLVLNTIWSIIFFGMKAPSYAFIEITFLWLAILATIILFYRISPTAAYLLIPYIMWVSFAAVLNFSLWRLNA